jgi:hypothetical protein
VYGDDGWAKLSIYLLFIICLNLASLTGRRYYFLPFFIKFICIYNSPIFLKFNFEVVKFTREYSILTVKILKYVSTT